MEVEQFLNTIQRFVSTTPDKVMFVDENGTRQTSYAEFWALTQQMAALVSRRLGRRERLFVPIYLKDSMEYFAAELAVWMTGNATVHMGVSFPPERVGYIMQHCEAELMIDDRFTAEARQQQERFTDIRRRTADQPCAMFYTSGSTGNPKGVLHSDAGFMHSIFRFHEGFSLSGYRKMTLTPSFYFVAMVTAYNLMVQGTEIHILPNEAKHNVRMLEDYIADHEIEFAHISPSILRAFKNKGKHLRTVKAAGERMVGCYSDEYTVLNCYGQTEQSSSLFIKVVDRNYDNTPIGRPCPGVEYKLLDDNGNEVPDGEVGELCYTSGVYPPVYYKDPERTRALTAGGVMHTGDLLRKLPNGDALYVQRKDWMVKINGQRVEPGEVENVMRHIAGVKDAIVKGFTTDDLTRQYLVGYYILEEDATLDADSIKAEMTKKVPEYMVPQYMVRMDSFPLNASNKIDRKNLLPPDLSSMQNQYAAPTNEVERKLCDAFAKVLHLERVGIDDDFFYLGGDSIRVMQLQQHLGMKHLTTLVNSGRTPRKIAEQYAAMEQSVTSGIGKDGRYPLMDIQETYLRICLPLEGKPVMNLVALLRLDEAVDLQRLAAAIAQAVACHPALFVRFRRTDKGTIVQTIRQEPVTIAVEQLTDEDFETLKPRLVTPFRYLEDRLFQFRLFQTPTARYFFHNIHHSVFDGESKTILYADIERAYAGQTLEAEKASYLTIAAEENALRSTPYYSKAREGFRTMFDGAPHTLYVENAGAGYLETSRRLLSVEASEATTFCAARRTTMNVLTTAAFAMLLGRETASTDIVFGSQYSGRTDARVARMIGSFAKPVFMRISWDKDVTSSDYLTLVTAAVNQSITNSIYTYGEMKKDDLVRSQIQFVYQDEIPQEPMVGGRPTKTVDFRRNQTPSILVVNIFRDVAANQLTIRAAYRPDLFSKEKIEGMLSTYDECLRYLMK